MNKELREKGTKRIEWADNDMPVLRSVRERFKREKPFKGIRLSAVLHVTAETANLVRTLKEGGASVLLAASNPLSTQNDVVESLNHTYGIPTYAERGESKEEFFKHIKTLSTAKPHITMDDGADLVSTLHSEFPELCSSVIGGTEETTTGVLRLRAMEKAGALRFPVVAVNDAKTKNLFDNRYGTGQSTIDGIIRATDVLLAGKTCVIAGYGWCGKGLAQRARGMGAQVVVTEVDAIKALEAAMDGCMVMSMDDAASIGDVFCTVTGNKDVIVRKHFLKMKDGAIVCNSGHFDVEINLKHLAELAGTVQKGVRPHVDAYILSKGKKIYILAEGRLVNLGAAEGHPASVMDMSFATQALAAEWLVREKPNGQSVLEVPHAIEEKVATEKLSSLGISIDTLTREQKKYIDSWHEGT